MVPFLKVIDLFLPPRCVRCRKIVSDPHALCLDCWQEAAFISAPFCKICGLPFEYESGPDVLCLDCQRCAPPFVAARAVFPYDDFSRDLVLSFKHGDRCDLAPAFANWMMRSASDLIEASDLIVPVPLHWRRLVKRRFNQAALLGHHIAKQKGIECDPQALKRVRATLPQGHLSRIARQKNLKGAFSCPRDVTGRKVLLIDDVMTTGATILNCTDVLLKSGAAEVRILTLSRVF